MEKCCIHGSKLLHLLEIVQARGISRRAQVLVINPDASAITRCARCKHVRIMSNVIQQLHT